MMFKLLTRYIIKTIVLSTLFTTVVITAVMFLLSLLSEAKHIGTGDYGVLQAVFYVILRMPKEIYKFSPMLVLLGSIIGLSILSANRELSIMRTSGVAIKQIVVSTLMAAFIIIMLLGVVGEWIGPNLSYKAEINKENAKNAGQAVITASGVWMHIDNNFVHVRHVIGRQLLEGVTRYQFDDQHHLLSAYFAKLLVYQENQWQMYDMLKTNFFPEHTESTRAIKSGWDLKFSSSLLNVGLVDPSEMSLRKLSRLSRYLEKNGLQAIEYRYEFWQRIFQPIAALIMVFLSVPFVLGMLRTTSLGWRLMIGIVSGFAFFISNAFLGQLSIVYQLPVLLSASLPLILFAFLGFLLSKRFLRH